MILSRMINGDGKYSSSLKVSPSSFRYYSTSVEYLTDHGNKSSPDSGHPSDDTNPVMSNGDGKGLYENLPFHGIQPPNKKVYTAVPYNIGQNHQSLPRHFLRELDALGADGRLTPNRALVGTLVHPHSQTGIHSQLLRTNFRVAPPGQFPTHNAGLPVSRALPTVSATLYDQLPSSSTSSSSAHSAQLAGRPSFKYQPLARPALPGPPVMARPGHMGLSPLEPGRNGAHILGGSQSGPQPKQFDSYYYHPSTLQRATACASQVVGGPTKAGLTGPPTFTNNRVVYADLNLQSAADPQADNRATDYAILKFNPNQQVGQEIDV